MNTGNMRNWKPLTISLQKITDANGFLETNEAGETYLASFLGWDRGSKIVADGTTEQAALKRLAQLTETPEAVIAACPMQREYSHQL